MQEVTGPDRAAGGARRPPAGWRPPRSATTRCSWSGSCTTRATSRCRCSPTTTATSSTSASGSARCSAATRRSSRRRRRRCWMRPTRARIGEAACQAARSVDYSGAGTVEFLVSADAPDDFFFMEMNTRLQVEHPVTEMVTGIDLVEWQVRIAAGEVLTIAQDDGADSRGTPSRPGVYAENPERGFLPSTGTILALSEPSGDRRPGGQLPASRAWRSPAELRPDARQGRSPGRAPARKRSPGWMPHWPTPSCWASRPTSNSCAACSPIRMSTPATSTRR